MLDGQVLHHHPPVMHPIALHDIDDVLGVLGVAPLDAYVRGVPVLPHNLHELVDLHSFQSRVRVGSLHDFLDLLVGLSSFAQVHNKVMHQGHDCEEDSNVDGFVRGSNN